MRAEDDVPAHALPWLKDKHTSLHDDMWQNRSEIYCNPFAGFLFFSCPVIKLVKVGLLHWGVVVQAEG